MIQKANKQTKKILCNPEKANINNFQFQFVQGD